MHIINSSDFKQTKNKKTMSNLDELKTSILADGIIDADEVRKLNAV